MKKLLLYSSVFVFLAALPVGVTLAQDETKYCDNSGQKDSKTRFHNCDCNRAHEECGPDHPQPDAPMYGCKTYCKPEHCDCSTKSCS